MNVNHFSFFRVISTTLGTLILFSLLLGSDASYSAQCFSPLPKSEIDKYFQSRTPPEPSLWTMILELSPPKPARGIKHIQKIADGVGDKINLDYYGLTFTPPPNRDIESFFHQIRTKFSRIVADTKENQFKPYSKKLNDSTSRINNKLWNSQQPKNAAMTFVLKQHRPALLFRGTLGSFVFALKHGDVQVGCYSNTDFIFMTVNSESGSQHPVSGSRGFGLKDNGNGTWTFYSMAADRRTDWLGNKAVYVLEGFDEDAVFKKGHAFWLGFFPSMERYLRSRGVSFNGRSFIYISNRYDYPLRG